MGSAVLLVVVECFSHASCGRYSSGHTVYLGISFKFLKGSIIRLEWEKKKLPIDLNIQYIEAFNFACIVKK